MKKKMILGGVSQIYFRIGGGGSSDTPKLYSVIYEQPLTGDLRAFSYVARDDLRTFRALHPDLLQYYMGGVSRDPKFVLRNIWTAP